MDSGPENTTAAIPIANPAGAEVLFMVIVFLPKYDMWRGSITTAEGVCVARVSRETPPPRPLNPGDPVKIGLGAAPAVPIVWGGEHFSKVYHTQPRVRKECCCWEPVIHAVGPVNKITYAENVNDRRTDLKIIGTLCLSPCVVGFACLLAMTYCPKEHPFKNQDGEHVGHLELPHYQIMFGNIISGEGPPRTNVVHLAGATTEQRRLALVAALYETAAWGAQPARQNTTYHGGG